MGSHYLLQDIFLTQGWNLDLLHYRLILDHLSHQEVHMISRYRRGKKNHPIANVL